MVVLVSVVSVEPAIDQNLAQTVAMAATVVT